MDGRGRRSPRQPARRRPSPRGHTPTDNRAGTPTSRLASPPSPPPSGRRGARAPRPRGASVRERASAGAPSYSSATVAEVQPSRGGPCVRGRRLLDTALAPFRSPEARRLALIFAVVYFAQGMWGLPVQARSEEHTSELQSPCNLVCRLLLEKKKK